MMMEVMKMLSVSETASLFGINVRTLHFYDSIGLLKPSEISEAGYRFYNEDALDTLRRILILRELQFPLKEIGEIVNHAESDAMKLYTAHLDQLKEKQRHLNELISNLEKTIEGVNMEKIQSLLDIDVILSPEKRAALNSKFVERPEKPWSKSVRRLLGYFEKKGLPVEHIINVNHDIEIAAQFDGELVHPYKWSDEALFEIGKTVRNLHDAAKGFEMKSDDIWQPWGIRELGQGNRICSHGDIAPWNMLTQNAMPHRIVDWEFAGPIDPFVELARVCWLFPQLHDDDLGKLYDLPSPEKRAQQVRLICDGYGLAAEKRRLLTEQLIEVIICETAHEAIDPELTFDSNGQLWGFAWRTRSLYWVWRNRQTIESALN
jgi:DNA-binding transcriptional MerR regulator